MEFLPQLQLGWLNGWLLLLFFYGLFAIALLIFPREVVKRLYDRTGWTKRDYRRRLFAFPVAILAIGLFIFLPLKLGTAPFWIGLAVYVLGLIVFNLALFNYRHTPLDQPVTQGIYHYSRNPQHVGLMLVFLGTAVAVASWLMVIFVLLMGIGAHGRILAEERACLLQYGDDYQAYMDSIPRYLGMPNQPAAQMKGS